MGFARYRILELALPTFTAADRNVVTALNLTVLVTGGHITVTSGCIMVGPHRLLPRASLDARPPASRFQLSEPPHGARSTALASGTNAVKSAGFVGAVPGGARRTTRPK